MRSSFEAAGLPSVSSLGQRERDRTYAMLKTLIVLMALTAGAALVTKPSEADVQTLIAAELRAAIDAEELDIGADPAAALLLGLCQSDAAACVDLARQAIEATYDDRVLYANVTLDGFGRRTDCTAVFARLFCGGAF